MRSQGTGQGRTEKVRELMFWRVSEVGSEVGSGTTSRCREPVGKGDGGWLLGSNIIQVLVKN